MGARDKLNGLHGLGIFVVAGFIGACSQSWTVFFVAAAIMAGIAILSGDIRLTNRHRK